MSNNLLTPQMITREALRVLHQKLNFVGNINRQYDKSFAQEGAKIGSTLKVRLPNQYSVRTGQTINVQDTAETFVPLTVSTQKGVDTQFSSQDLTMSLDDYSDRILKPAMSVLAANIESDAMSMYNSVYNEVSVPGAAIAVSGSIKNILDGAKKLTDNLAPSSDRTLNLNTADNAALVSELKGLFNDPAKISKQYKEGKITNQFLGYENVYENTMWPIHTTGTDDGTGTYLFDATGAHNGTDGLLTVKTGTGTLNYGDIVFIAGVFRVHPETKQSTGKLQQFVVTANYAGGAGNLGISPSIVATGAYQNVSNLPAANTNIYKRQSDQTTAIGNGVAYNISMGFHKDAFTFATADLKMPKGVNFAAREVMDGISMRIVSQYDIVNDTFPCRMDVLYGYAALRPQLAVRYGFNS